LVIERLVSQNTRIQTLFQHNLGQFIDAIVVVKCFLDVQVFFFSPVQKVIPHEPFATKMLAQFVFLWAEVET